MNSAEIKTQLKALDLRLTFDIVREAVQRLKNGDSVYSLYEGSGKIVAKATAGKIRNLWNQGKLNFVLDVSHEATIAEEVSKDAVLAGNPFADFTLQDPTEVVERFTELWPQLPKLDWTIEVLERAGIEADDALAMMTEVDEFTRLDRARRWAKADLIRIAELHYVFLFAGANAARVQPAPHELIQFAARNYAIGLVDSNLFMTKVALDLLRYQVWRGPKFLQAFQAAQIPTSNAAKRRRQRTNEELERILAGDQLGRSTETSEEGISDV